MGDYKFSFHERGKLYAPAWMSPEGKRGYAFFSSEIMRIPIGKYYIQFIIVHFRKRRVFAINIENMNLYVKQVLKQKCPYWTNIIMLWRSRCCMLIILLLLWYKCIVLHDFSPSETTRGHQPEGSRHVELCCTAVGTWNQRGAARRVVSHGDWNESKYWVIRGVGNILKPLIFEKKKYFFLVLNIYFKHYLYVEIKIKHIININKIFALSYHFEF